MVFNVDVLNRRLRFAAIRIATGSQRFQIARFETQGQKLFESLLRLYYFSLIRWASNHAIRSASDQKRAIRDLNRAIRDI